MRAFHAAMSVAAPAQAARCLWSKSAAVRPSIARMNICRSPRSSPLAKARMVICGRAFPECRGAGSGVRICNVLFRGAEVNRRPGYQSMVPRITVCTWPPDQTSPSASMCSSSSASWPTSRPWLAV